MIKQYCKHGTTLANAYQETGHPFLKHVVAVALVFLVLGMPNSRGQESAIVKSPELLSLVSANPDDRYQLGASFRQLELECLFYNNAIADYTIYDQDGQPVFVFASIVTTIASYKLFPSVLGVVAGKWKRFPVPVTSQGWNYVHVSDDMHNIVAVTDNVMESGGWELTFVLSNDGGKNWRYGDQIKKYLYSNGLSHFTMNANGSGVAVEYNDGDTGGYDEIGYFVSWTGNWGETWSTHEFHQSFDTDSYASVASASHELRLSRLKLSELNLPAFHGCDSRESTS